MAKLHNKRAMDGLKRSYSHQEVTEILKRALSQKSLGTEDLSHQDLVDMAAEIGIDRNALDAATAELAQKQAEELARRTGTEELAEERARQLSSFIASLVSFLFGSAVVYFVDLRLSIAGWAYWVLLVWGLLVAIQIRHVIAPHGRLERRRRRERRQQAREEQRRKRAAMRDEFWARFQNLGRADQPKVRRSMNESSREFEQAVEAGLAALLSVAARKIQEHAGRRRC